MEDSDTGRLQDGRANGHEGDPRDLGQEETQPAPAWSGSELRQGLAVTGLVQYLRSGPQLDVKKTMPLQFSMEIGDCEGVALQQNHGDILVSAVGKAYFLVWYNACVTPVFGATASLRLELDGEEVQGGCCAGRSAYFLGAGMSLCAHAVLCLQAGESRLLRLVNNDGDADISDAALLVIRLGGCT